MTSPPPADRPPWPDLGRQVLVSALVLLACALAGLLGAYTDGRAPGAAPLYWPVAGIALSVLLRFGPAQLPAVLLGLALAHHQQGAPMPWALATATGAAASAWVAARWLRQARFNPDLEQQRDLWQMLGVAAVGTSLVSAANTALWTWLAGRVHLVELPALAGHWWLAEALGLVSAGVPLLTLTRRKLVTAMAAGQRTRNLGLLAASALAVALSWWPPAGLGQAGFGLLLLPLLLLSGLAMRSGLVVASSSALLLTLALVAGSAAGLGPLPLEGSPAAAEAWAGVAAATGPGAILWAWIAVLNALVLLTHAQVGALMRREERWQVALDSSDLGVADWDLRSGSATTSPRWRALMADPSGEQTSTLERWLAQVHAEDRAALRSALSAVDGAGDSLANAGLRCEVRLRVRDAWLWVDAHVRVTERDPGGAPQRVVATVADIGARHQAEARQQLAATVFEHLHEGLVITDPDLRVVEANPAYCRITGTPRAQLIGRVPALLQPAAGDVRQRQQLASLWAGLRGPGRWVGEWLGQHADGSPRTLQVTASRIAGPDAKTRCHVLVLADVTEQHLQRERLARQAHFDELTRLPNRTRLAQLMAEAMAATDRDGCLLAVCCLDLDRFKAINDSHGHAAGDRLLAEVAERLRSTLRTRGHSWTDAAARLGGDEFVLLLRATTVDEARAAVERVLQVVAQPLLLNADSLPELITASVGATVYPLDASDADTLLRHADHAMFGVKQSGRNGYLFFDPENSRRHQQRMLALGRLQEALDRDELLLYYQPKVDLKRGLVTGVEALLRWNHPERGVLPPAEFLPLIENTGLSASVGDHVLARAIEQLAVWQAQGLDLTVSVNISARHLQAPDFAQRLAELLARQAEPLGPRLELEVLETAALQDIGFTSTQLERCARLGVRWALDDFGTGYSTLTYLKRLPVQVLKVDRSFVHNMLTDGQDRAIVEGVISLARTFGCTAVAEGVETAAQARMLLEMGCEIGQGTGIAPPMPAAEVAPWVREWRGLFSLSAAHGIGLEPDHGERDSAGNESSPGGARA